MRATPGLEGDGREAIRTFFCRRLGRRWGGSFIEPVDALDHQEDGKGDDDEVDDVGGEQAVIPGDHPGDLLSLEQRGANCHLFCTLDHDEQVAEIHIAQQETNGRHEDVVDQRADDLAEGRADDDADRQVDHVAAHDELLKFFEQKYLSCNNGG